MAAASRALPDRRNGRAARSDAFAICSYSCGSGRRLARREMTTCLTVWRHQMGPSTWLERLMVTGMDRTLAKVTFCSSNSTQTVMRSGVGRWVRWRWELHSSCPHRTEGRARRDPTVREFPSFLQGGTSSDDGLYGASVLESGDIIMAGYTFGDWTSSNSGDEDLVMLQFDPDGNIVWQWQVSKTARHGGLMPERIPRDHYRHMGRFRKLS